jgi:hypothetical protein
MARKANKKTKGLDGRHRDTTGRIDKKHGNTVSARYARPMASILPRAAART